MKDLIISLHSFMDPFYLDIHMGESKALGLGEQELLIFMCCGFVYLNYIKKKHEISGIINRKQQWT